MLLFDHTNHRDAVMIPSFIAKQAVTVDLRVKRDKNSDWLRHQSTQSLRCL